MEVCCLRAQPALSIGPERRHERLQRRYDQRQRPGRVRPGDAHAERQHVGQLPLAGRARRLIAYTSIFLKEESDETYAKDRAVVRDGGRAAGLERLRWGRTI